MSRRAQHGPSSRLGQSARGRVASSGAATTWILQLWACFGLLVVSLSAYAASTTAARAIISSAAVSSTASTGARSDDADLVHEGDSDARSAHEVSAIEPESDDEDGKSGLAALPHAHAPALAWAVASKARCSAPVRRGCALVSTGLARGPPSAA